MLFLAASLKLSKSGTTKTTNISYHRQIKREKKFGAVRVFVGPVATFDILSLVDAAVRLSDGVNIQV